MSEPKAERKWVIGVESSFGPSEEVVVRIPRPFPGEDDWYFLYRFKTAAHQSRVFDTPQEAALGAIKSNETTIRSLSVHNERLREWYDGSH